MADESIDPVEVLQAILNNLVSSSDTKEDVIKLWFYIGRMMGISDIFPEMQVVVTPDDEGKNEPVLLVGTLVPYIVDMLTSEKVLTEDLARLCLEEIKEIERKKVYH